MRDDLIAGFTMGLVIFAASLLCAAADLQINGWVW